VVYGAAASIDFYCDVFGATERLRMGGGETPDKIGHAEVEIGRGLIMVADEYPAMGSLGPGTVGGTPVSISVYVDDVDDVFARALAAGATQLRAVQTQFYGDRQGHFEDPFGHRWSVASRVEDLSPEEIARRAEDPSFGHDET